MTIIVSLLLIAGGLASIFYLRPKFQNDVTEIKYLQTKTIAELEDMFKQMDSNGLGSDYREFVELKGNAIADNLVTTPYSNKQVVYCESELVRVTETTERYRDNDGNLTTRQKRNDTTISSEKSSQQIFMKDNSTSNPVTLEVNATGCKLDIQKTFDRFEPKVNLGKYTFNNVFSMNGLGSDVVGFKMVEKTIEQNQNLYVIGEAFKVGDSIHIGKPRDSKKPFIVTTKSEEDLINKSKQNSIIALIAGIIIIVIGVAMLFAK